MGEIDDLLARSEALRLRFQNADQRHRTASAGAQRVREQARLTRDRLRDDWATFLERVEDGPHPA
ncbi:hypothetical protein [Azospirillum sp. ST 5-10]|uniref:hypothetical protein n=1 Tax=unclassified Azospirillum TaxID=2630922 RepID=UPI003F4A5F64